MMENTTITPQPKERVIFDAYLYLGQEGEDMVVEDIMEREDLTKEEVIEHYSDSDLFSRALEMRDNDFEEETDALVGWFDGNVPGFISSITDDKSDWYGNPVIVSGSVGRWNGTHSGFTVYDSFQQAIDTSPSRYGGDNVFADCEIQKIWDENGHLFLSGAHHDGSVRVELRQLTNAGVDAYETIADAYIGEPFTINGKTYDGSDASLNEAVSDLWENPQFTETPRYMEKAFGFPAEEYKEQERPKEQSQTPQKAVSLAVEATGSRDASQALDGHVTTAPIHETTR